MMGAVRRIIAILLFAAFVLPFALPGLALGQDGEAGLPACCRRTGVHHCGMNRAEPQASAATVSTDLRWKDLQWKAPLQRCPFCPGTLTASHENLLALPAAQGSFAEFFSHPAGLAQTESKWRIARDRSRQKRGPPAAFLA
ncbi:MAG: hypothetical protein ACRYFU_14440 [Janthinobacterium lividum]